MSDTGESSEQTGSSADEAPYADPIEEWDEANDLVTNDAVAGETILPGAGDGNNGPTGGSPGEAQPMMDEHGFESEDIDLDDEADVD